MSNPSEQQGKQWQRIHDFLHNVNFKVEIERIRGIPEPEKDDFDFDSAPRYQEITKLAKKCKLGLDGQQIILEYVEGEAIEYLLDEYGDPDLCVTRIDNLKDYPELKKDLGDNIRKSLPDDPDGTSFFPISIGISPVAMKEDVRKFIEENWETEIRPLLDKFGSERKKGDRDDQRVSDFLAERAGTPIATLQKALHDELGVDLPYHEVKSRQRHELDRRKKPIEEI